MATPPTSRAFLEKMEEDYLATLKQQAPSIYPQLRQPLEKLESVRAEIQKYKDFEAEHSAFK